MTGASIGLRRCRFVRQHPVETPDGAGGVTRAWQDGAPFWGTLQAVAADEDWRGERPAQHRLWRIVARHGAGPIDAGMRLRLMDRAVGERVFDVTSAVDPDGRRRHLVVTAQEIVP